ncbi:hypothetical protein F116p20 [Pseudomonas phage F116]|uniref:Uncharacterized protein n=7 Tax=root TaxID=1 RepID=Q5QF90_9CAUD|nr:hypothetical protein QGM58_gp21 [Pseudomonas phage LKA5]YP_164284.1 hypothetical protein F116p20 [Pseudomonas phage F116]AAT47219.1 unknown [Pseudomonas phage F116]AGR46374.1 hypothetical protein LKA5_020 [Pseudomonas phage LKA5]
MQSSATTARGRNAQHGGALKATAPNYSSPWSRRTARWSAICRSIATRSQLRRSRRPEAQSTKPREGPPHEAKCDWRPPGAHRSCVGNRRAGPGGSVLRLADLQDAPDMNAKRKAIWVGGLIGGLLFLLILALGPIWGGLITAEQPATAPAAVKRATP